VTPDDRDNPFGPPPPEDPFGPPPKIDPFGRDRAAGSHGPAPADPYGPPQADPYGAPPADPFGAPHKGSRANAEGAVPALVLGIVGIVFCPLCAPFAWYYGRRAEQLVDSSGGALGGRGEATAGKILGIVSCALMLLAVILLIVFGVLLAAGTSTSGGFS